MAQLTLIRHGQASLGADDYDQLSDHGYWQSTALGAHFATGRVAFDRCVSGTLKRQRQTAKTVLDELPDIHRAVSEHAGFNEYETQPVFSRYMPPLLAADSELREIFHADRAASRDNREVSRRVFFPVLNAWLADAGRADLGFENFLQFKARVAAALSQTADNAKPGENVAVFTSSGVIAVAALLALNLPDSAFADVGWHIHNASVTRLAVEHGRFGLIQFNATMHLEATGRNDALTWL
ncbi:MAG: histidine phosphatase family protein [Gammaproteobacteria bacterium]